MGERNFYKTLFIQWEFSTSLAESTIVPQNMLYPTSPICFNDEVTCTFQMRYIDPKSEKNQGTKSKRKDKNYDFAALQIKTENDQFEIVRATSWS